MSEAALQKVVAANPVAAHVDGEPAKHTKHMCHPFIGYDQAPAQVGNDDGPARIRGSGGDDGGGSGGGSDCAFLRRADHGGAS